MKVFLTIASVLVGLANIYIIGLIGGAPAVPTRVTSWPSLLLAVLCAVVAGFVASETALRLGRPALQGGFFIR